MKLGGKMKEIELCKEESKFFDEMVERLIDEHEGGICSNCREGNSCIC